jgi:uncharacterized protein YggT (Ycf19 family)
VTLARAISYVAYAWVVISLIILAFGFFLLLFGANPDASFTQWVYRHLADTMEPFRGIFPQQTTPSGSTLDVSVLFAMFVYCLIALGVRSVIDWLTYRRDRLDRRVQRDRALLERSRVEAARVRAEPARGSTQPMAGSPQRPDDDHARR